MDIIWILSAFAAGLIAKTVKMPTLVGYLLAGVILSLFGVSNSDLITAIGDMGVTLLLFTIGLHISLKSLLQKEIFGVGLIHLTGSTLLFSLVMIVVGTPVFVAVILAAALGFSSTVLTAKSLEARDELDSYHGRLSIGILILQDVVALLILILAGGSAPAPWAIALVALVLLRPIFIRIMLASGREEVLLLFGLGMALGIGWLFELVGLDGKLGALVAGMLLAGEARSDELYDKLWALKELFLVGFFLQIGLGGLPSAESWRLIGVLLLLLPVKAIAFFALFVAFRLRARTAFLSTVALSAYSEFALIVVVMAASTGLVDQEMVVTLGVLVAISYTINAPISRIANRLWARWEPFLNRFERPGPHKDHEPLTLGLSDYVVLGMGRAGAAAYDFLASQDARPLGLDSDPERLREHLAAGRRIIYGDAKDPELWTGLDLSAVRGVMLTMNNVNAEVRAARNLRTEGYAGPISALLRYDENRQALTEAGVNLTLLPIERMGRELAEACMVPLDATPVQAVV
jgi:predicted Kef-type K+ transport protein